MIASFAVFLIKENYSTSKHLQYLSGCNSNIFWISSFIWDMCNYLFTITFVLLLLKLFGIEEFMGEQRWLYVIGLLVLYGFSHIPQMYLFSYLFQISATGFAFLVGWNILSSQATLTPVQILSLPMLKLVNVSVILEWIFLLIFPNFSMGQGLIDLYTNYQIGKFCTEYQEFCDIVPNPCCGNWPSTKPNKCGNQTDCLPWTDDYFSWEKPGLMRFFIFMPTQFLIQFGIILIFEAGYFRKLKYKLETVFRNRSKSRIDQSQLDLEQEFGDIKKDSDVLREEERIENLVIQNSLMSNRKEIFLVDRLTKYYSNFMAVKGVSFTMNPSETFGLLGVNGAGKTTTFKMLTGYEIFNNGDAYLNGISLKDNIKKVNHFRTNFFPELKISF